MKVRDICSWLETIIPLGFQENYDNSGLQIGNDEKEINSLLLTLDITEEVIEEAVKNGCGLIISHHPLIFNKLSSITGKNSTERMIISAVKNDLAIYAVHTNLDVINNGVSFKMASIMGLKNVKVLSPIKNKLLKLVTFVPDQYAESVREALFEAGAGHISGYDKCSFNSPGSGSFRAGENTNPFTGEKGKLHFEKETRIETIMTLFQKKNVINALLKTHPYEEPAYDIYLLENDYPGSGMGCTGEFDEAMDETAFLNLLANKFSAQGLRYSSLTGRKVKKVSLCGGSGISLLNDAKAAGSQAFVTSDVKYHNFFDADKKMLIADIGHFESEIFSREILYDLIIKKFPKFAVRFSEINTNPINYF